MGMLDHNELWRHSRLVIFQHSNKRATVSAGQGLVKNLTGYIQLFNLYVFVVSDLVGTAKGFPDLKKSFDSQSWVHSITTFGFTIKAIH